MVKLQIKSGDENQFLLETTTNENIDSLTRNIVEIFNTRLKIYRICGGKLKYFDITHYKMNYKKIFSFQKLKSLQNMALVYLQTCKD